MPEGESAGSMDLIRTFSLHKHDERDDAISTATSKKSRKKFAAAKSAAKNYM
jgi:hypothetical protein